MKIQNYTIDNIKLEDHPKYCDAYLSYAEDEKGRELTDLELERWQEENPEEFYELIQEAVRCV